MKLSSRQRVIVIEGTLIVALIVVGVLWVDGHRLAGVPERLGPISIGVPYFGALGGLLRSLDGALRLHRKDWDGSFEAWHHFRIIIGAVAGTIAVLIFVSGILGAGLDIEAAEPSTPRDLSFFLLAFICGYRERLFFDLLQKLADVVLTTASRPPAIDQVNPDQGPAGGGGDVHLVGRSLSVVTAIYFADEKVEDVKLHSDTLIIVKAPPGTSGTTIPVSATSPAGSATTTYRYTEP